MLPFQKQVVDLKQRLAATENDLKIAEAAASKDHLDSQVHYIFMCIMYMYMYMYIYGTLFLFIFCLLINSSKGSYNNSYIYFLLVNM